jgi:hypothetical protein
MLKALGYPVLAVGLVMGLQTFIPTAPAPFVPAPVDEEIAFLPPKAPPPAPRAVPAIVPPKPVLVSRARPTGQTASNATAAATTVTVSPWRTAVMPFQGTGDTQAAITSTTASSDAGRYELARNIQRELKRVGCYYGEIDGSWGLGSKRALSAFMDRVNASLPITEPDYILLALIRAQPAAACSVSCPPGQTQAAGGRCVPNAIFAQTMKKNGATDIRTATVPSNAQIAWTAEVRPSAGDANRLPLAAPLTGRMSVGGPPPGAAFGDPPANGFASPARNGATYETAALTDGNEPPSDTGVVDVTTQDMMPSAISPAPPRAAKVSKPARRQASRSRSVQQLFMHPLGRM